MRFLVAVASGASLVSLAACTVSVPPITCDDTANPCYDAGVVEPPDATYPDWPDAEPPRPPDGGPRPDAGPDTGPRPDAGPPPDAGPDARPDAGPDSGPDAGDPCEGVVCDLPNSTSVCVQGKCMVLECNPGFGDCDGNTHNGCEPLSTFFEDKDGDGHGIASSTTAACTVPAGFSTLADDCDDDDNRAFPGQSAYFNTPRVSGGFDFNCDGNESMQNTRVDPQQCVCNGNACSLSRGWKSTVPSCGDSAEYAIGPTAPDACDIDYVSLAQSCR